MKYKLEVSHIEPMIGKHKGVIDVLIYYRYFDDPEKAYDEMKRLMEVYSSYAVDPHVEELYSSSVYKRYKLFTGKILVDFGMPEYYYFHITDVIN